MYFVSHATFSLLCYFLPLLLPTLHLHSQWALQNRDLSSSCNFRLLTFPSKVTQCRISGHTPCLVMRGVGKEVLPVPLLPFSHCTALTLLPYQQGQPLAVRQCPEGQCLGISAGTARLLPLPPVHAAIAPSTPCTGHWPRVAPAP